MNLKDYAAVERGRYRSIGKATGVDEAYIWQIANGSRVAAPALCVLIERATNLEVRRWDLRPVDWWRIWPELIGIPGSPALTTARPQAAA